MGETLQLWNRCEASVLDNFFESGFVAARCGPGDLSDSALGWPFEFT
jgi:hypothetical protein